MESIRRAIKIFWSEHSGPIIFYTIVFTVIILVVQGLNAVAKNKLSREKAKESLNQNAIVQDSIKNANQKEEKKLIDQFIKACIENNIQGAYGMLSENCKKDL